MCATPARHRASRMDESAVERGFWAARDLIEGTGQGRSARHARKVPSRYALHIGRVGALAVSLGVGLAVANSSGVAYADSESVSSGAEADADSPSAGSRKSPESPADDTSEGSSENSSEADKDPASADDDEDADEQEPSTDEDPGTTEQQDPDGEPEATVPEVDEEDTTPPSPEGPTEEPSVPPADADDTTAVPPATGDATAPRDSDEPDVVSGESVVSDDELEPEPDVVTPPSEDGGSKTDVVTVGVVGTDTTEAAVASAAPPAEETVNIVAALVSSVVSPFADPAAPAQAPWFDALLAWVRRQINHTFFNKTPVAGAVTTEQILTGQVLVTIPAYDPNGDPLTYTIVQPASGLVYRDPITGKFVYTPTSVITDPTTVTFQVKINDSSEHLTGGLGAITNVLHFISRLFGLAQTDNLTVPVSFTINPLVQLPPSVVTIGTPIFKLGGSPVKVVSSATITDLDSDLLLGTISLTVFPAVSISRFRLPGIGR